MKVAHIAVALSGGVDSAVAALLLRQQGHEVCGVTMRIRASSSSSAEPALEDARQVARQLGIPHRIFDLEASFAARVVKPFCSAYLAGRTPNPCPACNRLLKFGELLALARQELGAELLATGHYARLSREPSLGRWQLRRGVDPAKDQSYVLHGLSQQQLAQCRFPLGELRKDEEVRRLAAGAGLELAGKKESQDACFIGGDLRRFLQQQVGGSIRPGRIVDRAGRELGEHPGVAFYTLGQRRGLGRGHGQPLYVVEIRPETDELVVGPLEQTLASGLRCRSFNWVSLPPTGRLACQVKIRYAAPPQPAVLELDGDGEGCRIEFARPQPSITPGQGAVAYRDDLLVGGGEIETVEV